MAAANRSRRASEGCYDEPELKSSTEERQPERREIRKGGRSSPGSAASA